MNKKLMTNWRWWMVVLLFVATTINYMDRQVLSLTWKDFIAPEFHWTDADYGNITAVFSIVYAICMLFAGKFVDWMGTKKGYLWAIFVWSLGACAHALCGWATMHVTGNTSIEAMEALQMGSKAALAVSTVSVWFFIAARTILALGEAGNFPAAIKTAAEYFPKKDRAFATSIFNSGASVGALVAPISIPVIAQYFKDAGVGGGWEMAFIIIGALGFIWMGFWIFMYSKPEKSKHVNKAELDYIQQDDDQAKEETSEKEFKIPYWKSFTYRQTWLYIVGRFLTDGVWWFFLFWAPAYFSDQFGYRSSDGMGMALIITLYAIVTFVSIFGGYLPKLFVEKKGMNPYQGRMLAMLIFAFFPLAALFAQPLGTISPWWPAILIGLAGAGHQAWSANMYSTIGDMFPKSSVATITGIGGLAAGMSSFLINKCAGWLFTYSAGQFTLGENKYELSAKSINDFIAFMIDKGLYTKDKIVQMIEPINAKFLNPEQIESFKDTFEINTIGLNSFEAVDYLKAIVEMLGCTITQAPLEALGFAGKPAGYMIVFCICAVAYLVAWICMKILVPRYKKIEA